MQQEKEKEFETLNGNQRVTVMLWKSDPTRQRSEHIALKLLSNNGESIYVSLWEEDRGNTHHSGNPNDIHFHSSSEDGNALGNPNRQFDLYSLDVNKMITTFNNFRSAQSPWSAFGDGIDRLFDVYRMKNTNGFLLALLNDGGLFPALGYETLSDYFRAFDIKLLLDPGYLMELGFMIFCNVIEGVCKSALLTTGLSLPYLVISGTTFATLLTSGGLASIIYIAGTGLGTLIFSGKLLYSDMRDFNFMHLFSQCHTGNLCLSATQQEQVKLIHAKPTRITALIQKTCWGIDCLSKFLTLDFWWGAADSWWGAAEKTNLALATGNLSTHRTITSNLTTSNTSKANQLNELDNNNGRTEGQTNHYTEFFDTKQAQTRTRKKPLDEASDYDSDSDQECSSSC